MILFLTSSLRTSTDVPGGRLPFVCSDVPAEELTPSLWRDCTSHSRDIVAVVGVGTDDGYGRLGGAAGKEDGGAPPPLAAFGLDLKLASRFCADDLRRMAGRGGSEMGAMDITGLNPLKADMADVALRLRGNLAWRPR